MNIEQIKDRIRKLLVRTEDNGATPAEAAQAMELAAKLMNKAGISEAEVSGQKQGEEKMELASSRVPPWCEVLAWAIERGFKVECVITRWRGGRRNAVFTFRGPEHHASVAAWLFQAVCNDLLKLANREARAAGCKAGKLVEYRNSFLKEAAWEIWDRLSPNNQQAIEAVDEKLEAAGCKPARPRKVPRLTETQLAAAMRGSAVGKEVSLATNAVGNQRGQAGNLTREPAGYLE